LILGRVKTHRGFSQLRHQHTSNAGTLWGLSLGLLDAYLDAKAEADFLQIRGVKLVVAMEMLKEAFLRASGYPDLLRPKPQFRAMVSDLKDSVKVVIVRHGFSNAERPMVYRNIPGVNRVPFEEIVAKL
jgi:hypothetical protein